MTKTGRNRIYDSLKFWAALLIFSQHLFKEFFFDALGLWDTYPTKYILNGFTGKAAVAMFGVILGYFAYRGGQRKSDQTVINYSAKRYIYFAVCGLLINAVIAIVMGLEGRGLVSSIVYVIKESLFINGTINETYWCMKDFLVASIICFVMGKANTRFRDNVFIVAILCISHVWVGVCLMGTLIDGLLEKADFLKKPICQIVLVVLIFILIKREESMMTYIIQGICALMIIILANVNGVFKGFLNLGFTAKLGTMSMAIFLIHVVIYRLAAPVIISMTPNLSFVPQTFVCWIVCFTIITGLAFVVNPFTLWVSNRIGQMLEYKSVI